MFLIPRLVKKHSETWEKQFDLKRRASIESRRQLLSSTDSGGPLTSGDTYEIAVFSTTDDVNPVAQVSIERPNYTRGRRRSLPALYISSHPCPGLSTDTPHLLPIQSRIVHQSAEMSSGNRANSTDSHLVSSNQNNGGSLATDQQRPNRTRVRRGSLPAIGYRPSNSAQRDGKLMPRMVLVDANLFALQGIPVVNVNTPSQFKLNKRRGSLPPVNYPDLANPPASAKSLQAKGWNLNRRRGSLPAVSLTIPKERHGLVDDSDLTATKESLSAQSVLPTEGRQKDSIDELEEESHQGNEGNLRKNRDNTRLADA